MDRIQGHRLSFFLRGISFWYGVVGELDWVWRCGFGFIEFTLRLKPVLDIPFLAPCGLPLLLIFENSAEGRNDVDHSTVVYEKSSPYILVIHCCTTYGRLPT